jgi:DNA-binding MarR family transcriptional regulator
LTGLSRSSGQFVQALEREELILPLSTEGGHAQYTLTDRGALAAGLIGLAHAPLSASDLRARISQRRARRRDQLAVNTSQRQSVAGAASKGQASVLRTLMAEGPMTLSALLARMDAPPAHPRSMHLMLRTLERRGSIERQSPLAGTRAPLWRVRIAERFHIDPHVLAG